MKIIFEKINGKIVQSDALQKEFNAMISRLRNGEYVLFAERKENKRSLQQNSIMWMWFTCLSQETGSLKERLKDSISSLIDNFKYQKPNISDIISFDRKIKLYSYGEAYRLIERGEVSGFSDFEIIELNGEKYRIKKSDKINLP